MLAILLTGCGSGKKDIHNFNEAAIKPLKDIQFYEEDNGLQSGWSSTERHRMTDLGENQILVMFNYYDYSNKVEMLCMVESEGQEAKCNILCNEEGCTHKNDSCPAYFGKFEEQIWSYNDKLYGVTTRFDRKYLVEISADGKERNELFSIGEAGVTSTTTNETSLVFNDGFVYVTEKPNKDYNGLEHKSIRKYSLDGKTSEVIVETEKANGAFDNLMCYGGNLFFRYYEKSYDTKNKKSVYQISGLFYYDTKTGELNKILDEAVTGYDFDFENHMMYCFIASDGLYQYDLTTGDRKKLYDAEKIEGNCDVFSDEYAIYLNNYRLLQKLSKEGEPIGQIINTDDVVAGNDKDLVYMTDGLNLCYFKRDTPPEKYVRQTTVYYRVFD